MDSEAAEVVVVVVVAASQVVEVVEEIAGKNLKRLIHLIFRLSKI